MGYAVTAQIVDPSTISETKEWYENQLQLANQRIAELEKQIKSSGPCDRCRFNPPSSCDGKPCCMCVAEKIIEEGEG